MPAAMDRRQTALVALQRSFAAPEAPEAEVPVRSVSQPFTVSPTSVPSGPLVAVTAVVSTVEWRGHQRRQWRRRTRWTKLQRVPEGRPPFVDSWGGITAGRRCRQEGGGGQRSHGWRWLWRPGVAEKRRVERRGWPNSHDHQGVRRERPRGGRRQSGRDGSGRLLRGSRRGWHEEEPLLPAVQRFMGKNGFMVRLGLGEERAG